MAFLDPAGTGRVPCRAYRLLRSQFADVAAQEMHREPLADLDLQRVLMHGRESYGPGRYETLVRLGDMDGAPMLTLTAPWRAEDVRPTAPSAAYLTVIAAGLRESHGWSSRRVTEHLTGLPGVRPTWDDERLLSACSRDISSGASALSVGAGPVGSCRDLCDEPDAASGRPPPSGAF